MSTVVGPNAGVYTATIDNETVIVDAYRNTSEPACDVSWSRFGLENTTHVVTVVFKGASTEAGPAGASNASLEITRFTCVMMILLLFLFFFSVGVYLCYFYTLISPFVDQY